MPMLNADQASVAEVAYVQVLADGSSPNLNSGVTTARTGTGVYTVTLPPGEGQTYDLIFVQVVGAGPRGYSTNVEDTSPTVKTVYISAGPSNPVDIAFSLQIIRSTLS
jgi:hypothetical protein